MRRIVALHSPTDSSGTVCVAPSQDFLIEIIRSELSPAVLPNSMVMPTWRRFGTKRRIAWDSSLSVAGYGPCSSAGISSKSTRSSARS
jgi:hypothetical protein